MTEARPERPRRSVPRPRPIRTSRQSFYHDPPHGFLAMILKNNSTPIVDITRAIPRMLVERGFVNSSISER